MLIRSSTSPGSGQGPALPELHRRLRYVAIVFVAAIVLLVGRLWQLQVLRGDSYYERTISNVVKESYLPSVRGKILDRNGVALADNRPAFNIYATPATLTPAVSDELSRLLTLSDDDLAKIKERIAVGTRHDASAPVLVLEDQGRDRAALVEQARARLPGVEVRHEPYRYYPLGDTSAHLLGYMTQMTAAEADRLIAQQNYDPSELVGRYGLEAAWENYLRGKKGITRYAVDARGQRLDDETAAQLIDGERTIDAVPGANVVLTIDAQLQQLAETAAKGMSAVAIVVVEVKTGKLRAVVSRPSFDPNTMTGHLTQQEYELLKTDPRKPFIDKALRATYPPGSIYKFAAAFAALEDGQAAEDEPMFCNGEYQLSGTTFHCHGTHNKIDLLGAIQKSCDTYFWHLAERVGLDRISEVAREYGLGAPTTLGLNGDAAGLIPTKAWYDEHGRYKVGFATNAAIGQGDVEVTPLQMAMAYAAIGNGGTLYVPQVVERIDAPDGHAIASFEPKVAHQIKTPPAILETWKKGMWKVANEPGGTAYDVAHTDIPVLGKTGTAEVKKHHKAEADERDLENWHPIAAHAWFAGLAPASDPEIAVIVLVEHGGSGGRVAWPVAKRVIEGYFAKPAVRAPAGAPAPAQEKTP
jgi:penicillin-binding protein 2